MNTIKRQSKFTTLSISALLGLLSYSLTNLVANNAYSRTDDNFYTADSQQYKQIISQPRLEQLLAPVALYPDTLLSHILIASTYPVQLVQAHRWRQKHQYLSQKQLQNRANKKNWDPSVVTLVAFPSILQRLSENLNWTQDIGQAFIQNEQRVLASIQNLRQQADNANSLDEMENMSVNYVDKQIIIEPRYREVIYVPYYDPRVVYGQWRWHKHPPIYWNTRPYYSGVHIDLGQQYGHTHSNRHNHQRFYWGSGIQISFNYFFSTFHWRKQHIVVTSHHNSHYYRPKHRIITSHGAQRWHKRPHYGKGRYKAKARNHHRASFNSHLRMKPKHRTEHARKSLINRGDKKRHETYVKTGIKPISPSISTKYKQIKPRAVYKPRPKVIKAQRNQPHRANSRRQHDTRQKVR